MIEVGRELLNSCFSGKIFYEDDMAVISLGVNGSNRPIGYMILKPDIMKVWFGQDAVCRVRAAAQPLEEALHIYCEPWIPSICAMF
jgi:hypothetical protein